MRCKDSSCPTSLDADRFVGGSKASCEGRFCGIRDVLTADTSSSVALLQASPPTREEFNVLLCSSVSVGPDTVPSFERGLDWSATDSDSCCLNDLLIPWVSGVRVGVRVRRTKEGES